MGSAPSKRLDGRPTVVIVGGGYGGVAAAQALDSKFNVVVFERRPQFFHNIAAVRAAAGDERFPPQALLIPYDKALTNGYVIQAEVTRVTPSAVYLHGRERPVAFDYLVLACGSSYTAPGNSLQVFPDAITQEYNEVAAAVQAASAYVVVGGGPVGLEFAGELRDRFPDRPVTLIHRSGRLIGGRLSERLSAELEQRAQRRGITVILGESVDLEADPDLHEAVRQRRGYVTGKREVRTNKGRAVEADFVALCMGSRVNNDVFKKAEDASVWHLDADGRLQVNETLRVEGMSNVFAIGDVANVAQTKMAYFASEQGKYVSKVITALDSGKSPTPYDASAVAMLVTIGENEGAVQLGTKVFGRTVSSALKGKSLLVDRRWKEMHQTPPKRFADAPKFDFARHRADSIASITPADATALAALLKVSDEDAREFMAGLPPSKS